ncbi:hypothetical protein, partial [Candidatus Paracaedibacter symbiosus]|uniref:hypothetical protein n=1 Tax=Candidatus Paracaedibacter symbiosus TaxID=244582 RepID=UPI000509F860
MNYFKEKNKLTYFLKSCLWVLCWLSLVPCLSASELSDESVSLKVHKKLFYHYLTQLPKPEQPHTLFIIYYPDNDSHAQRVEKLARHLNKLGILEIYFDKFTRRSGGEYTISRHSDLVFKANKVLIVGS